MQALVFLRYDPYEPVLFLTMKKILYLLFSMSILLGQNILSRVDHPVYQYLERQESLGNIQSEYWSTRPYTLNQINKMLMEVESRSGDLSANDIHILKRFQIEFNRDFANEGITFPWSKSNLASLRKPGSQSIKPFFITYKQSGMTGWINWRETFRIQGQGSDSRGFHTDYLGISGEKGSIAFTTQYTFHRVTRNDAFDQLPDSYKEGYILNRDYIRWINWGYPTSSLTYTHSDFTLGIHRQPIYWGYSRNNSPIFSDNVNPLPHVQWTTETTHLRFKFVHARLSPNSASIADTSNIRRNLSAHRVEFDISPKFEFAFSEMVIYAYRDFELGYLNPVNFLFAEEQASGDLDNKLMAIDFKWHTFSGFTTYGTWFFDELDFWKLFSGWWGNKFVFQLGGTYYPSASLPSINVEYTATRPWTYSHSNPVNSFTSGGRILGLKDGANTHSLRIRPEWQLNQKLYLRGEYARIVRGDDPGSEVLNSYSDREIENGEDTSFIVGELETFYYSSVLINYYLNSTTSVLFSWEQDKVFEFGIKFDW